MKIGYVWTKFWEFKVRLPFRMSALEAQIYFTKLKKVKLDLN